jgi:hypothetical protein
MSLVYVHKIDLQSGFFLLSGFLEDTTTGRKPLQKVTKHAAVDAVMALRVIRHSWEFCDYLIEQDDLLDGTIHELHTSSKAEVVDIDQDIDADMPPFAVEEDA